MEAFDFVFQSSIDCDRIIALAQLDFIEHTEVVHFLGPSGTGRSHLVKALAAAAVKAGKSFYRCTLAELIEVLSRVEPDGRLVENPCFCCQAAFLLIDDIDEVGCLSITVGGADLFFKLVIASYEKGEMILTDNRGFAELREAFSDPVVAPALLDRLLHYVVVVKIEGANYPNAPCCPPRPGHHQMTRPKAILPTESTALLFTAYFHCFPKLSSHSIYS